MPKTSRTQCKSLSEQSETKPEQQPDKLKQLRADIRTASKSLNPRQRKFCQLMAVGDKSGAACARGAGYSTHAAYGKASRLNRLEHIQLLTDKYRELNAFEHGRGVAWYRNQLEEVLELAKAKTDTGPANSILRTMMELDGLLSTGKGKVNTSIQIVITTGLSSAAPSVIEGEVIPKNTR